MTPDAFIARWRHADGSELANAQSFVRELCELLEVPPPDPARADTAENAYVFERRVVFRHGDGGSSEGRIDCYRRAAFVLESKKLRQGVESRAFDDGMLRARAQGENYVRALPPEEGRPPLLLVVDVGRVIELYAEFSRSGGAYTPFPDTRRHRIRLEELREPAVRERLRRVWLDPMSLDPARVSARVTRDIAQRLADIARALEADGHDAEAVAQFLTRCLFCFFAEDVGLLPRADGKGAFTALLESLARAPEQFVPLVGEVWRAMDAGGFSVALRAELPRFNGKLFKDPRVLSLTRAQIVLLTAAGRADWAEVEPAIFGTLLESALDPRERHDLGAHYTPRAYVERLVLPSVIDPLRADWRDTQAAALLLANEGRLKDAADLVRAWHHKLCGIRVLDPACGSGNFLYVTLEHMKRLEGEVLDALAQFGDTQQRLEVEGLSVDPHQFLGLEINPRAAAIAEMVLWIGYLQWHFRTRGAGLPPSPILRDFHNIECRDAVLAYDRVDYATDAAGIPLTRWDGRATRPHPVTGEAVPDEAARVPLERYHNPRPAAWPAANYIVGNPPFIGAAAMRQALGDGYTEALRAAWPQVPDSADFVMFWWHHAADLTRRGEAQRFGFITTNSLKQTFNRRVLDHHLGAAPPLSLAWAIPDHPWVDAASGAAVRIAMSVGRAGHAPGLLQTVVAEGGAEGDAVHIALAGKTGRIHADLSIGADVAGAGALRANSGISSPGFKLHGAGFIVTPEEAAVLRPPERPPFGKGGPGGIHASEGTAGVENPPQPPFSKGGSGMAGEAAAPVIRPYRNGRDLTDRPRGVLLIDAWGLGEDELRQRHPAVWQWLHERVKPERDAKAHSADGAAYARLWWLHGKPRPELRKALAGLPRYIATVETAKHRVFQFLDAAIAPDNMLVCVALADAYALGVLSSRVHVAWALAAGGTLEDRPRYNKSRCFDPFPFPDARPAQQARIAAIAEQLDAHRKRQQAAHPELTLTGLYNVLAKLRSGEPLNAKDKATHEMGLVAVLRQFHDELDAAVLDAYGWQDLIAVTPAQAGVTAIMDTDILLGRLVALNAERAAEEAAGHIRWLRPDFQHPAAPAAGGDQAKIRLPAAAAAAPAAARPGKQPWPATLPEQVAAIARILAESPAPLDEAGLAEHFAGKGPWKKRLPQLLDTLVALGRARAVAGGWMG
jgi:hypothetical protein